MKKILAALALTTALTLPGLAMAREIYADRAYAANGNLLSRKLPGAVLHDADEAATRVLRMVEAQAVTAVDGTRFAVRIDTVCVHGDTPGSVAMARRVRETLVTAGVEIAPMRTVLDGV